MFTEENENGMTPRDIFDKYGFETDVLGMKRIESSGK